MNAKPVHTPTNTSSKRRKMGIKKEKTFVLVLRNPCNIPILGSILRVFEEKGLTVVGLEMKKVNYKFAHTHFSRPGRMFSPDEDAEIWSKNAMYYPNIAMILEGEDAIRVAHKYAKEDIVISSQLDECIFPGHEILYTSESNEAAEEDIGWWFPEVTHQYNHWSDDFLEKDLLFVLPDGLRSNKKLEEERLSRDGFERYFYGQSLTFILIKPVAVRERLVSEIISGFECYTNAMKGLKLVDGVFLDSVLPEARLADSSSSGTAKDDYGVVMVLLGVNEELLKWTETGTNHCAFNHTTKELKVDKDLVFMSEPGYMSWARALKCFPWGFVLLPQKSPQAILEASLTSL